MIAECMSGAALPAGFTDYNIEPLIARTRNMKICLELRHVY